MSDEQMPAWLSERVDRLKGAARRLRHEGQAPAADDAFVLWMDIVAIEREWRPLGPVPRPQP